MASVQRKVAFYHLTQERTGDDHRKHAVSNANIETNFRHIYNQMTVLENQRRAAKIMSGNVKFVTEIVRYDPDNHFAFIKIGHQNHANTTSLRDQNTLEATNVPMQPSQRLELFTYCYIDFANFRDFLYLVCFGLSFRPFQYEKQKLNLISFGGCLKLMRQPPVYYCRLDKSLNM